MSNRITKKVNNEAIFNDKLYVKNLSRSDKKLLGIKPDGQPSKEMQKHIHNMAEHRTSGGYVLRDSATMAPINKRGAIVRNTYIDILTKKGKDVIKTFLKKHKRSSKFQRVAKTAKPNRVVGVVRQTPVIIGRVRSTTDSIVMAPSFFKRVLHKSF